MGKAQDLDAGNSDVRPAETTVETVETVEAMDYQAADKVGSSVYGGFAGFLSPLAGLATYAFNGAVTTPALDAVLATTAIAALAYVAATACEKDKKPEYDMKKVASSMFVSSVATLSLIFAAYATDMTDGNHDAVSATVPCAAQESSAKACEAQQPVQKP